jgi:hypothetical protein
MTNPDLFWALKGGGGGSFAVVSKVTVRLHDPPTYFGFTNFQVQAASDDAYRRLVREFVSFYAEHLLNHHWGEQARLHPENTLEISMASQGLDADQMKKIWRPFLNWVRRSSQDYSIKTRVVIGIVPARHYWDMTWWKEQWPEISFPKTNPLIGFFDYALAHVLPQPTFNFDVRPGAGPNNAWWKGDDGQCGWFIWGFESLWLPASLLESAAQQQDLADALFAASRKSYFELHFGRGLAGAPPEALDAAKDTATNPAVLTAFALAIVADAQGPAYPGIPGFEPSLDRGRAGAARIRQCVDKLRAIVPNGGAYVSESNYFEHEFQKAYWGGNYPRLA